MVKKHINKQIVAYLVNTIEIPSSFFTIGERYSNKRKILIPVPKNKKFIVGESLYNCLMLLKEGEPSQIGLVSRQGTDFKKLNRTRKLPTSLYFESIIAPYEEFRGITPESVFDNMKDIRSIGFDKFPVRYKDSRHDYLLLHTGKQPELTLSCLEHLLRKSIENENN